MRFLFKAVTAAACGLLVCASVHAADIAATYQLNAAHDGQIKFVKPFKGPLVRKWSVDLGGGVSSPVFADGRVFGAVSKNDGTYLDALDASSGAVLWEVNTQGSLQSAYDGGHVYMVNGSGLVQAYNAADGSIAWTEQQDGQGFYYSSPVASGGNVFFLSASSGDLTARNGKRGTFRWNAGAGGTEMLPAVVGSTVFTASPCNVFAFDTKTGGRKWAFQTGCSGGGGGMPIYFEDRIYVNDGAESVVLNAENGKKVRKLATFFYPPAFWTNPSGDSLGFVLDDAGQLHAFDTVTGQKVWTTQSAFTTPPLVINDTIVIGRGYDLYGLDVNTGAVLWSQSLEVSIGVGFFNAPLGFGAGTNRLFVPNDTAISAWQSPKSN